MGKFYFNQNNDHEEFFKKCNLTELQSWENEHDNVELLIFHDAQMALFANSSHYTMRVRELVEEYNEDNLQKALGGNAPCNGSIFLEVTGSDKDGLTIEKVDTFTNTFFYYILIPNIEDWNVVIDIQKFIDALLYEENAGEIKTRCIDLLYLAFNNDNLNCSAISKLSDNMRSKLDILYETFFPSLFLPELYVMTKLQFVFQVEFPWQRLHDVFGHNCPLRYREKLLDEDPFNDNVNVKKIHDYFIKHEGFCTKDDFPEQFNFKQQEIDLEKIKDFFHHTNIIIIFCKEPNLGLFAFDVLINAIKMKFNNRLLLVTSQGVIRSNWAGWQRESQSIQVIQKIKKEGLKVIPLDLDYECSIFFDVKEGKESPLLPQWTELLGDQCLPAIRLDSLLSINQQSASQEVQVTSGSSDGQCVEATKDGTTDGKKIEGRFINTMVTIGH